MKKIFVSDFDGTATALDFYKIVLNDIGDEAWAYVNEYRKTGKVDYHFLNKIFAWKSYSEEAYQSLIKEVELDPTLKVFLQYLDQESIDFKFVSAGFDRYIEDVLKEAGYHLEVMTNPGIFKEGMMKMIPDPKDPFYSDLFGIDKGKVLEAIKKDYDLVYFAGDTEPDLQAALQADVVYAKGELIGFLEMHGKEYIAFESFQDILNSLRHKI